MTGYRIPTTPTHYLRISNCLFKSGMAKVGGGACIIVTMTVDGFDDIVNETNEWMSILHSHFVGNTGLYGGGLAVSILYSPSTNDLFHLNALVNTVYVKNTTFTDNAAWLGSAVFVTHSKLNTIVAVGLQQFIFENTSFHHNHLKKSVSLFPKDGTILDHKSTAFFKYIQNVTMSNCEFIQNNVTALAAEQTNIIFTGDVLFRENSGSFGGALSLFYSFQFIFPQTNLLFLNNHAERFGGAIYYILQVETIVNVSSVSSCLMSLLVVPPNTTLEDSGVSVDFINNTAIDAGDAIYGTPVDAEVCTTVTAQYVELKSASKQSSDSMLTFTGQIGKFHCDICCEKNMLL